jgi:hypothetical protein
MASALHFEVAQAELHAAFNQLDENLTAQDKRRRRRSPTADAQACERHLGR